MKKRFSVLLVALIALALFGFASQTKVNANDDNIITYGDFEDLELGNLPDPANDKGYGSGNWDSYAQVVVDPLDEDNQVVKFSYTVEGKGFASFFKFATVKDGVTYEIELDYLVEGTTDNFGMRFAPICGDDVLKVFYSGAATDGWQHAKFELTTNKDGAYDSIGVWFNTGSNEANAGYIDNIVIKEKAEEVEPDPNIISHGDIEALELGNLPDPANAQGFGSGNWDSYAQVVADPLNADNKVIKFAYTVEGKGFASFFKFATVKDGVTYEIELDYLVVGSTDNFGMRFAPINGDDVLQVFYSGAATDGWQHAKFELTTNKDGAYDSIGVWFNTGSNEENAGYIDNIVIKEKEAEAPVDPVDPDPEPESPFDPNKTYYQSKTTTVNGDFEKFEVGTTFSEAQLEGAWGSVSLDMPGKIVTVDGSKVVDLTKTDDTHTYASCFLMLPDTLEVGDMLRLSYDIKLVINDEAASYTAIDSCFVGGANKSYYLINYKTIALAAGDSGKTSGNETIHYPVVITALENGWFNVTIDVQLTNKDLIQTNSIRWLFTPKSAEEHMYIDNVNIYMLSETPFNYDKAVESVRFNDGSSVSLKVGDEKTLAYTINPDDATDKSVTFTTSNANVASVDENGKVTAKAAGACSITITTANGKTAQIAVVVSAQAPTEEPATQPKTGCRAGKAILAEISLLCAVMFVVRKRKDLF